MLLFGTNLVTMSENFKAEKYKFCFGSLLLAKQLCIKVKNLFDLMVTFGHLIFYLFAYVLFGHLVFYLFSLQDSIFSTSSLENTPRFAKSGLDSGNLYICTS